MKEQVEKISGKEGVDKGQDGKVAGLLAAWEVAVDKCKGLKYDQYRIDVAEKKAARESTLTAIERLLDARKTIAHGATNGRCEKPQSNGDHLRRGKCAAESDCCGAATGRPHGATGPLVTIEVCQEKASKTWGYVAPRAPLATAEPAADPWPFKCIDGASKLAGAAAAVLTSAYMMA